MVDTVRVLIVDDDPAQAEMVMEFLHISGFSPVSRVRDIQSLWSCLESEQYDIILLDYLLPDGTGLDALAGMASRGYALPVVMVTGQGDERVAVQALQRGAADYLIKSGDYLLTLPSLIRKTVRAHQLQISVQRSLEQIRYQATLLNNVRDAIVVWDMEGLISYWNPAAVALFGWTAEERLSRPVSDVYLSIFTPPIVTPREGDTIGRHIERQCLTRNQQALWVSSRIAGLYDAESRLIGYMDVTHDITQRKQAEQALRAERNFVTAVLDTVGALVVVLDRQGRIVRFNRACEQITGESFQDVQGKTLWDQFLLPDQATPVKHLFQQMQLNMAESRNFPSEHENIWITRRGQHRLIAWSNTAITQRNGQVEYVIATGLDITERRKAEQSLLESEARYRAIVEDYQTELICRFLPDGRLTFVNEVFCRCFGKKREELIGANFLSFIPVEDRQAVIQHLASFSLEQPVKNIEHQIILPTGELRWHQWADRAIFEETNNLFEFQAVGRDITERKRMEAQIQVAQTHLVQAARLATIGEMAAGIAHQINNPLTTIIAEAQMLLRNLPVDHPERESAEAIQQAGWRLQEAVQRLTEFSRPTTATLEEISINQVIERAVNLVGAHIEAAGVKLTCSLAENLPPMRGNAQQMVDLWVNLLLLARDATDDGMGHNIQVRSYGSSTGSIFVEVVDDGSPIPAEQLDTIFEPNFIGPSCERGTGMELSICREIVRQHGGQITAESTAGRDTIFRVMLPSLMQTRQPVPGETKDEFSQSQVRECQ